MSEKKKSFVLKEPHRGSIAWQCPSNIALVKYWGKKGNQLPVNPSLSMTLSNSFTEMRMEFRMQERPGNISLEYYFDDKRNPGFEVRIRSYLAGLSVDLPYLNHLHLTLNSRNTFPHSTGIASSASSMGALALCLSSLEQEMFGMHQDDFAFRSRASFLARLASGSASRSVYGGFVVWGHFPSLPGSSDEMAIPLPFQPENVFNGLKDSILVVSKQAKSVSSSAGHALMNGHSYAEARIRNASINLDGLLSALRQGDLEGFFTITEWEALNLHALMMTSSRAYLLIEPNTLRIVKALRSMRETEGLPVCFTLDAGPNVHLLYPAAEEVKVRDWIDSRLKEYCEDGTVIHDQCGKGPQRTE